MNTTQSLWTIENVRLGQLLVAAQEMQSFVHDNWTSAQQRHKTMPTSENHWTRSQLRRSSMLAVHSRPVPDSPIGEESDASDAAVDICVRRNKLSKAWGMMQECGTEVWVDVCNLLSLIVAVEEGNEKFPPEVVEEVFEAKLLMEMANILDAVETIKSYDQEEWMGINSTPYIEARWASKQIHHGSLLAVHAHHHDQSPMEAKVRHAEHATAWERMRECDKAEWTAACHFQEEYKAKCDELEEAVATFQEFNNEDWTGAHLRHKVLPAAEPHWTATQIHHGSSLVVRARPVPEKENDDPSYQEHKKKLNKAWEVMHEVGSEEWIKACKKHEDMSRQQKGPCSFQTGVIRTAQPMRNGVGGHAA